LRQSQIPPLAALKNSSQAGISQIGSSTLIACPVISASEYP
jgi:hypothetical protein